MTTYQCLGCGKYFPAERLMTEHGEAVLRDPVRLAEHKAYEPESA
jgi:hypothetical protein